MKKNLFKNAWTLSELVISLIIIGILSVAFFNVMKFAMQKNKIFSYVAMKNLEKATSGIVEKTGYLKQVIDGEGKYISSIGEDSTDDAYCMYVNDNLTIKKTTGCTISDGAEMDKGSVVLPNNITYYGLANKYIVDSDDDSYSYKHLMIDINGEEKPNQVGVDRIPVDVYTGSYAGVIRPSDCRIADNKNPYCSDDINFRNDNSLISYDVYEMSLAGKNSRNKPLLNDVNLAQADCFAYGGARGILTRRDCANLGYHLSKFCANDVTCYECNKDLNVCPTDEGYTSQDGCIAKAQSENQDGLPCVTILHKPNVATTLFFRGIVADIMRD